MTLLLGPDCSHYQSGIDLTKVASEGHSFVIGKVSQGSSSRDPQWPLTRDQGKAAGLLVAAYHYVDTSNADRQAANCAGWIGDKTIPIALDWEAGGGNWANLLAVLAAFRRAGLNVRLLYTGPGYWQAQGSPDMSGTGLALWKAHYPSTVTGTPSGLYANVPQSFWAPMGGLETRLLQFAETALVAGMTTDCSAFLGTRDELAALLGITGGDPLTPEEHQMLADLHDRVARVETAWAGGYTDDKNTPYDVFMYGKRTNVELHQCWLAVQALAAKVDALTALVKQQSPKAP